MSILSPTRLKAIPVVDRLALLGPLTVASTAVIPVEVGRDLVLTLFNAHADTDYAGAKVAISGTNLAGVAGNWLSSQFSGYLPAERTSNDIALKRGITKLTLPRAIVETMQSISITGTGTAASPVTVFSSWTEPRCKAQWREISAADPFYKLNAGDKNWKITVSPKGVGVGNTVKIRAVSAGNYRSTMFLTEDFLQPIANEIEIAKPTVLYLNNIYDQPTFSVSVNCEGTATAAVLVEAMDQPRDASGYYSKLFETAISIGDAYFFRPKIDTHYVLARVKCTMTGSGTASVTFYPRTAAGVTLPVKFGEIGDTAKSNVVTFTGSGERFFYIPRTTDIDRIHARCDISGTATVLVSLANYSGEIVDGAAVTAQDQALYRAEGFDVRQYLSGVTSFAAFENWEASVTSGGVLSVSNGAVRGNIALTALPGWKSGDTVGAIGFIPYKQGGPTATNYSRETAMRLCFFTRLGNIYHNYPALNAGDSAVGLMMDFDLSAIYEPVLRISDGLSLSSERIPSTNPALTTEQKKTHRYEPGLPAWSYNQHTDNIGGVRADGSPYNSGGLAPTIDRDGIRFIRYLHPYAHGTNPQDGANPYVAGGYLSNPFSIKPKCTTYVPYNGLSPAKQVVLGTVDGGRIWTVLHELGCNSRTALTGNNLDFSALDASTDGALSVVRRNYIYPTNAVKEPANAFRYAAPVSVKSITTSGGKVTVETNGAHGISASDTVDHLICFKKNSASAFDFLENSVTDGQAAQFDSNSAGNGRFYRAVRLTSTTFELRQNYHGVDEKIACHHIHSGNPVKDGVIVSCGEKYPQGWILYVPIQEIDDYTWFNMWRYRSVRPYAFRLNSAEEGTQRPVGCGWNDDAAQNLMFASDEATIAARTIAIPGRTAGTLPTRNTAGLFRIAIGDIDDMQKAVCILEMEEASLGLVHVQGIYLVVGMSRKTYLSADAVKWASFPLVVQYVGESPGAIYLRSSTNIYRVTKT